MHCLNVNICPVPLQMSMSARRADITVTVGLDRAPIHSDRTTAPARRVGRETALLVKVDIMLMFVCHASYILHYV